MRAIKNEQKIKRIISKKYLKEIMNWKLKDKWVFRWEFNQYLNDYHCLRYDFTQFYN